MTELPSILRQIVATKHQEVALLHQQDHPPALSQPRHKRFVNALSPVGVIAEVKRASPSRGIIRTDFDPVVIARSYQQGGAVALSVLTDQVYFMGHADYIPPIRSACSLPILRKEFIIDRAQLDETVRLGADAVLLIAGILSDTQLHDLHAHAHSLGLDVLVEVHTADELDRVLGIPGVDLIGINNRDLHTFTVDLSVTLTLRPRIPHGIKVVAESGYRDPNDIQVLREHAIDAVLIGESLADDQVSRQLLRS